MTVLTAIAVLLLVYGSFAISASAGLGGSLLMVPTLALFLGSKEGVALAALLLASNNVMKIIAYRQTLPFRKASFIIVLIVLGSAVGSTLLVQAPEWAVTVGIVQRRPTPAIAPVDAGPAFFNQVLANVQVSLAGGDVQGGATIVVAKVNPCAA